MPRYPTQASLPSLKDLLPEFTKLEKTSAKLRQVAELLRPLIEAHRATRNLTFYSTRDIARFFGVSQNTATLVVKQLEGEGLLRRLRGSHTLMLGSKIVTRSRIRAVAGLMLWNFAQRFSEPHTTLVQSLGDALRPHHIALEIIPHYDLGDHRPDMDVLLSRHTLDFAIWPFPFRHHHDDMLRLQDRGTRNLVIGFEADAMAVPSTILVEIMPAYRKLLHYWREEHGIRRVLAIKPREFTARGRIEAFHALALEMGFDSEVVENSYDLPAAMLAKEKKRVGIALLDEHASAEFTFYDPPAFVGLLRRHRILYGNGGINVPFVPHGELRVDRIFVPNPSSPEKEVRMPFCAAVAQTLVQWCSGNFAAPPIRLRAALWKDGKLWRYL